MRLFRSPVPLAAAAALVIACINPAPAAMGKLDAPAVAFAVGYPKEAQASVQRALTRKDCKFLGGTWLNSWTTLRYAGDVWAVNQMIDDLTRCPGATVHVGFKRWDDEADWRVGHSAH